VSRWPLRILKSLGVFALTRALTAGRARILMYHNFSPSGSTDPDALSVEGVREQFVYLRRHYRVVPLRQIAEQLAGHRELDARSVALTIDDGRRNCYEFLFPLLKEFRFPATFFVASSFIRGEDWIWTDKVIWLSEQVNPPKDLIRGQLDPVFRSLNLLRPEERSARIEAMAKSAGLSIPPNPPQKYASCSWNELREMADAGLVEVGSHTATHPILSSLTDEESWDEITRSRAEIENGMGREVRAFCYPNGMPGDFRPSQVKQVEKAGYTCSVVAQFGLVQAGSDRFQLPRIAMARKTSTAEIAKFLDGFAYYQQCFDPRRHEGSANAKDI